MTTFVVAHGAWSSAWAWKKMRPLLRGAGHELWTPTYTGLGERAHLASPAVDLDTHIADVLGVLDMEDLQRHRADRAQLRRDGGDRRHRSCARPHRASSSISTPSCPGRPEPARSASRRKYATACASCAPHQRRRLAPAAQSDAAGHRPKPTWPGPSAARLPQPIKTFETPLRLTAGTPSPPRSYIYCKRIGPTDVVSPVRRTRATRKRLAPFRDRRQPQPAHHRAAGAAGAAGADRGDVGWAKAPAVAVM